MYENMTYKAILEEQLSKAPEGIDTRQGSVYYDAVSGFAFMAAKYYTDLEMVSKKTQIAKSWGDELTQLAADIGIYRLKPTKSKYNVEFDGTTPSSGERFYANDLYFVLKSNANSKYLECEIPGTKGNIILQGVNAVPVNNIEGLKSAKFGTLLENGTDEESDESLHRRCREKIANPAEGNNDQQYKSWAESIEGVGMARIFPLWNGPNTVKAVLIDSTGAPCSLAKVKEVQDYIDPATKGNTTVIGSKTYVVGDGLGHGVSHIGAHFTAVEANKLLVNVSLKAELAGGISKETAKQQIEEAVKKHFKVLALDTVNPDDVVVRLSAVGAIIANLDSVLDYSNLTINAATENIKPGPDDVPILGEVILLG